MTQHHDHSPRHPGLWPHEARYGRRHRPRRARSRRPRPARSRPCSGPTGPARRRSSAPSPRSSGPTAARCGWPASTPSRHPDAGAPGDRPRRPARGRRAGADRPREPGDGGPAVRPRPPRGAGGGRRCARPARARPTPPTGWCAATRAACAAASTSAPASSARPRLLLLDEPTTGLDPRSRIELWDAIRALVRSRHRRAAHDPVPRRGRPARRPHRDRRPRSGDRHRHARRAQEPGRSRRGRDPGPPSRRPRRGECGAGAARRRGAAGRRARPPGRRPGRRRHRAAWPTPCACWPSGGIAIDDVGLRRPTLDEVFLALTGRPAGDADTPTTHRRPIGRRLRGHPMTTHRVPRPRRPNPLPRALGRSHAGLLTVTPSAPPRRPDASAPASAGDAPRSRSPAAPCASSCAPRS